jgi:hypothetical protein
MTPIPCSAFLVFLAATGLAGAGIQHVVFDSHARTREKFATEYVPTLMHEFPVSEHTWALKDLNPDLPSDWSSFKFLVMEVKASSAQRFLLRLYTADGVRALRFHQFGGGVWIRAAVPLSYFQSQSQEGQDLAAVFNKPRSPFWMALVGPFGPIKAVASLAVAMVAPVGNPTLDVRNVRLSNDDPGSEVLDKLPVVDQFGQWIPAEYPGKIKSLEQLKSEWDREDKSLRPGEFGYCQYGGFASTQAKATGFFRVEQIDGKWWFVDPDDVIRLGRFFDVYSHNIYEYTPEREWVAKLYKLTGKPLLIGEFHFGTPTRGQAAALMQVASEKERGIAYRYYVEQVASMPSFVGAHWFAWLDESVTGRMDGENYSFGFIDVTDRASDEFLQGVIAAHKRLLAVHSGKSAPVSQKAKVQ